MMVKPHLRGDACNMGHDNQLRPIDFMIYQYIWQFMQIYLSTYTMNG